MTNTPERRAFKANLATMLSMSDLVTEAADRYLDCGFEIHRAALSGAVMGYKMAKERLLDAEKTNNKSIN